ncbi:MAG: hypothetical protein M1814_006644 [Vezdaea aestivalis]|nr:MAG: hypothetical protein M1814_006644 [Vezdaea aestivalis]
MGGQIMHKNLQNFAEKSYNDIISDSDLRKTRWRDLPPEKILLLEDVIQDGASAEIKDIDAKTAENSLWWNTIYRIHENHRKGKTRAQIPEIHPAAAEEVEAGVDETSKEQ